MDFTPELSAFQGAITSADNVHSFSKLTAKGGNESKIKDVIKSILKFLKDRNYIKKDEVAPDAITSMRKFAFYITLNSDLPVLKELVEVEGIDSVVWTIPGVTKCLMCEMIWNFHMDIFLYEIIVFSYPQFALEVAESFIDGIKYFTPAECLSKVEILSSACYKQVCRLHFFDNNIQLSCLTSISNCFKNAIKFFTNPPNAKKLSRLSKDEQYKYLGNCFHTILQVLFKCLEEFTVKQELEPASCDQIYSLTYKEGCVVMNSLDFSTCDSPNSSILECLDKCNIALLDTCKDLLMSISVDIFCAWSEFEEKGRSMQETIGEVCYKLRTKLLNVSSVSEHELVSMLEQISRKPIELNDIISCADNHTIIENIKKNNEDKISWIRALLDSEDFCSDQTLIEVLSSNVSFLNEDDSFTLYKKVTSYVTQNVEEVSNEDIDLLAIKAFQKCSTVQKLKILEDRFKDNCFYDMAENKEFSSMLTEIFNKLIASQDADLSEVLGVFLQSPQKVFTKIFTLATENAQQASIMLKIVTLLKNYSSHYYNIDTQPCIIRITQDSFKNDLETDAKILNLLNFISGLKSNDIIPGGKLLLLITMPNLHKALLVKDIKSMYTQIMLLDLAFCVNELLEYRAPMLAMLAQVLDIVRWKFDTFVPLAPATLQLTLQLQQSIFVSYHTTIPDNENMWLKSRLKNMQPLNMYYYRHLWNPPGKSFVEIISGTNIHVEMNVEQLKIWLSQVMCSSIQQEWCEIWDSLHPVFSETKTLDLMYSGVHLMAILEASNHTESTWLCLLHSYRNLMYIIRYKYFRDSLTTDKVMNVVSKIESIANKIDEEHVEDIKTTLLPLLAYIMERKDDHSVDIADCLRQKIKHKEISNIFNQVFSNGVQ